MAVEGTIVVRPVLASEFEQWAALYRGYRAFYELVPDETVIERVWGWISDDVTGRYVPVLPHSRLPSMFHTTALSMRAESVSPVPDSIGTSPAQLTRRPVAGKSASKAQVYT